MRLPHARPRWQVRLERLAYWLVIVGLLGCIWVAWTSVDPELASRGYR
jgi:hypothetical protein